jgi:hypothetical protein
MKLRIEASGYRTFISEETIGGNKPPPEELRFELVPAEDVRGTILDPNGKPVAGALISVRPANLLTSVAGTPTPEHVRLVTDRRGQFRFPAQAQSFSLHVLASQGSVVRRFGRNKWDLGEVRLQQNASVRGVVLRDGAPLEGATVNLYYGIGSDYAQTDADGRFEFPDLPSGNVTLHTTMPSRDGAEDTNPERLSKSIQLEPGDTANVTVEFER